jgi:hypothetical protein
MAFDWKAIIKTAAPLLGTSLYGPLGAAAGKLIAVALGGDETKATPDDLAKLVQSITPEQLLALKNADQAYAVQLKALDINEVKDLEALAVQDRGSARNMAVQLHDKTPAIGFYFTSAGFFSILLVLAFHAAPGGSRDLLNVMLGALGLAWGNQVKFFYGGGPNDTAISEMLHLSTPTEKA